MDETARSVLFVPGDRPERFAKAVASGADLVVLDLEDAVQPEHKDAARRHVTDWLSDGGRAAIRVNGHGTPWHEQDVGVLSHPGVQAVMYPKAGDVGALETFAATSPRPVPIVALIETALGVWNALDIAKVGNVVRLAFGTVDFQLDCGSDGSAEALLYARSRLVMASAIARIAPPLDGVTVQLGDEERLVSDLAYARALGFGGKLCIHPRQVEHANAAFRPSEEALDWARRVVDASETDAAGAFQVDGEIVDRPVLERAKRLLASAVRAA